MFGFLQGTSHDDDDVNMAGQAEHNLREPATSEGTGQIPIESGGGVTNCSDENLLSLHLNGDHSAATKPPSAVDALNHPGQTDTESAMPEISISSVSFSSSQNEDLASEAVSVLIIFYFSFIPHVKFYTALTIQSSPKSSFLLNNLRNLYRNLLRPFLPIPLFLILMRTKPLELITVK